MLDVCRHGPVVEAAASAESNINSALFHFLTSRFSFQQPSNPTSVSGFETLDELASRIAACFCRASFVTRLAASWHDKTPPPPPLLHCFYCGYGIAHTDTHAQLQYATQLLQQSVSKHGWRTLAHMSCLLIVSSPTVIATFCCRHAPPLFPFLHERGLQP